MIIIIFRFESFLEPAAACRFHISHCLEDEKPDDSPKKETMLFKPNRCGSVFFFFLTGHLI